MERNSEQVGRDVERQCEDDYSWCRYGCSQGSEEGGGSIPSFGRPRYDNTNESVVLSLGCCM